MFGGARSSAVRPVAGGLALAVILSFVWAVVGSSGTARAEIPDFDGLMIFPAIQDASDPEQYSWKVNLHEEQELVQIDDRDAVIYYPSGHAALSISAEPAHDAIGTDVPTTLDVTGSDIVTLTVHHSAGNLSAGGAPFDYPITAGQGWEGGYETVIVKGPPDEADLREQRERGLREASGVGLQESRCVVPSLEGRSLKASRRLLVKGGCSLGRVAFRKATHPKGAKVVAQGHWAGAVLNPGAPVSVKLA